MPVVAGCPAARAHTHAQRQERASPTFLLFPESPLSSWRGCGCTWPPWHMLGWRLRPFPWNLLQVHSTQQSSAHGYAQMHCLHCCETHSALGGCCFSLLLKLLITSLHRAAFLLFFLLSSFFVVCRLLPVPLHSQLLLHLFLLNPFFHLSFFLSK